jgi:DNA-directed RNA polymerase specialized sigma24 family protein
LNHFRNFVRQIRRVERHYDHSPSADRVLEAEWGRRGRTDPGKGLDPALLAEQQEARARLAAARARLPEDEARLWEELESGRPLHTIARELGRSYQEVKRRRRKLFAKIARWMEGTNP